MNNLIKKTVLSSFFLALALLLPFVTGQIKQLGNSILPMHIPIFLCGFILGPLYGALVGFIAPILRFSIFGMPIVFPDGLCMAFELGTYGFMSGFLYKHFPKNHIYIYASLIFAMIVGRIIWGITRWVLAICFNIKFSLAIFISGAFLNAIPGIIIQLLLIPTIIIILQKSGEMKNELN